MRASRVILVAGLVAGTLDILYVIIFYGWRGVSAARVVQGVAAGLIGREAAIKGGAPTVALGLAIHFAIALTVAASFYGLSRRFTVLVKHPLPSGVVFGIAVWLVMTLAVLPLTAVAPKSFPPAGWLPVLLAHIFCVGLPIALLTRRLARTKT